MFFMKSEYMRKIEFKVQDLKSGDYTFISSDNLKEMVCKKTGFEKCYLFQNTGVQCKNGTDIYEGEYVIANCRITNQKVEGEVVFKDGAFFVKDVCFPYLSDFEVLECALC